MALLKSKAGTNSSPKRPGAEQQTPNTGRRSFMWKVGAAMSAVVASAVAECRNTRSNPNASLKDQVDRLSNRIGSLEDANAIRRMHQTFESYLDRGMYEEVVDMFSDDGEVVFNGGLFAGKNKGICRLYCEYIPFWNDWEKARICTGLRAGSGARIEECGSGHRPQDRQGAIPLFHAGRKTYER